MSDTSQLSALRDRFTRAKRGIQRAVMSEMDKAAVDVRDHMRQTAPVDTGALRDSIAILKPAQNTWQIGPVGIEYAAAQEYGAKPHVIIASPGKVLVFSMGGKTVYTTKVNHPGNKPQPYIRPTADWARQSLSPRIAVIGNSMLSKNHA